MVLTKDNICFVRPESKLVVDSIPLKDIISVAMVDNLERKDPKNNLGNAMRPMPSKTAKNRRVSVVLDLHEQQTETFSFEIKADYGTMTRSYFVRVISPQDRDHWIDEIKRCVHEAKNERATKGSQLEVWQQHARDLHDHKLVRAVVACAILLDFLCSVFESEFSQVSEAHVLALFSSVDIFLCAFFSVELLVNMFGTWRNCWGAPFVLISSNWFKSLFLPVSQSIRLRCCSRFDRHRHIFDIAAVFLIQE